MSPEHPELKILGLPVYGESVREGFDPFYCIVHAHTPLGYFGASKCSENNWYWFLVTITRDADDFDTLGCDGFYTLESCIKNADRQLRWIAQKQEAPKNETHTD